MTFAYENRRSVLGPHVKRRPKHGGLRGSGDHVLLVDACEVAIAGLPSAAERCWAWARLGHDVAATEIARTPKGEQTSTAIFVYGALLDAMTDLEASGVTDRLTLVPLDLTRSQASRLLPQVLQRVIEEAASETTPALIDTMTWIAGDAARSYDALVPWDLNCQHLRRHGPWSDHNIHRHVRRYGVRESVTACDFQKSDSLSHCARGTCVLTVHDKPAQPSTPGLTHRIDQSSGREKPWTRPAPRCGTTPTFSISFAWVSRQPTNAWRAPTFPRPLLASSGTGGISPTTSSSGPGSRPAVARGSGAAPSHPDGSDRHDA